MYIFILYDNSIFLYSEDHFRFSSNINCFNGKKIITSTKIIFPCGYMNILNNLNLVIKSYLFKRTLRFYLKCTFIKLNKSQSVYPFNIHFFFSVKEPPFLFLYIALYNYL